MDEQNGEDAPRREWTAGAVAAHCSKAAEQGYMNASTAGAMATAVKKIVEAVHGANWEEQDLRSIDRDELFHRFEQLANFKVETIRVYQSRFTRAVESYDLRLRDPDAWVQSVRAKSRRSKSRTSNGESNGASKKANVDKGPTPMDLAPTPPRAPSQNAAQPAGDLVPYQFPLRPGVFAVLNLPQDLRTNEVKRLAAFLETLVLEPLPALGSGTPEQ
jgi:hypothetical protein